ncbi:hypothetical protein [Planomicrobium sp. CPCC 101079]|uniref:hypothetical protein n=1 Tax=Planomicrobium sp. CPCC 101079 TaxID=2599618 RepID=UPI0011B709D1|nr:hypothetical protein [Planomicrobium sp. CPCC 101079]TWT03607.1 hypothetical protein FQV28_11350 [Planomicrobium sp. CPCC 101079]
MTVLAGLGLFAVPILLIIGIVAVIRKTGTAKKWFKISGGVFVAAVIILIFFSNDNSSNTPVEEASTEVKAEETESSDEQQANQEEAEKQAEVEAAKAKENEENAKYANSFVNDIALINEDSLTLSDESYDFIVKNHSLFPALNEADIAKAKEMADSSITAKHLNKNAQPYFQNIATFQGTVVSVEEAPAEVSETISLTHVLDNNMQSYQVFMYKGTGEILEEDTVRFWGVPVGPSSFENVSGGATNVQVFLGSHIEKTQ